MPLKAVDVDSDIMCNEDMRHLRTGTIDASGMNGVLIKSNSINLTCEETQARLECSRDFHSCCCRRNGRGDIIFLSGQVLT